MTDAAIGDDAVPVLPRGVRLREDTARGGFVLMAPERVLKLDRIAHEILSRVDGRRDVRAIVDNLAEAFAADRAVIDRDVKAMLATLVAKRMLDV